jgi:hypothetical protein
MDTIYAALGQLTTVKDFNCLFHTFVHCSLRGKNWQRRSQEHQEGKDKAVPYARMREQA